MVLKDGAIDFSSVSIGDKFQSELLSFRSIVKCDDDHVMVIDKIREKEIIHTEEIKMSTIGKYYYIDGKNSFYPLLNKFWRKI